MANLFLFLMNCVIMLVVMAFAVVWFLPSLIMRGLNIIYRKLLGLDT